MKMKPNKSKTIGAKSVKRGHEDLTRHLELQILYDIFSALYSSPHLQDVLKRALSNILGTLKFKMGALYLVKESSGEKWLLELAAHHGFSPTLLNCYPVPDHALRDDGQVRRVGPDQVVSDLKAYFRHPARSA